MKDESTQVPKLVQVKDRLTHSTKQQHHQFGTLVPNTSNNESSKCLRTDSPSNGADRRGSQYHYHRYHPCWCAFLFGCWALKQQCHHHPLLRSVVAHSHIGQFAFDYVDRLVVTVARWMTLVRNFGSSSSLAAVKQQWRACYFGCPSYYYYCYCPNRPPKLHCE